MLDGDVCACVCAYWQNMIAMHVLLNSFSPGLCYCAIVQVRETGESIHDLVVCCSSFLNGWSRSIGGGIWGSADGCEGGLGGEWRREVKL